MPAIEAPPVAPPAIVVVGTREAAETTPSTMERVNAARLRETVAVRNTEDALRYFPSLLVRKRHIGDTQAPLATRTSGVGASARSLIYADGVLLSALIGNNNNFASPRWGMVSPDEIERVDVLYGPFSAAYPGNSIGAVVNITTRLPDRLEASVTRGDQRPELRASTATQRRLSRLSARRHARRPDRAASPGSSSANHVDSRSQPLAYVTVARPAAGGAGTPVTGAFADVNRTGAPICVIGAGGFEHQRQDNLKAQARARSAGPLHAHLADAACSSTTPTPGADLSRRGGDAGLSGHAQHRRPRRDHPGQRLLQQCLPARRAALDARADARAEPAAAFDWRAIGSLYDYDEGRAAHSLRRAAGRGCGRPGLDRPDGRHRLADARPRTATPRLRGHELHGGAHYDGFTLDSHRFTTADWRSGDAGPLAQQSRGRTRTLALVGRGPWIDLAARSC